MKKTFMVFMTVPILLALLAGCASLPVPESPSDTLLIIPVDSDQNTSYDWFGKVTIEIAREEDSQKAKSLKLSPTSSYSYRTVTDLPPGRYIINKLVFVYDESGNRGRPSDPGIRFTLKPGTITVLDYQFRYRLSPTGAGGYTLHYGFEGFQGTNRDEFLQRLRGIEGYDLWKAPE